MGLIWMRRMWLGLRLLMKGEWKPLVTQIGIVLKKPKFFAPRTGRLSAR
jgi:hypothetical protein